MSQIPSNQGAAKQSEIAVEPAQEVLGTGLREDGLTVVEQLRRISTDALRKSSFILLSDGTITWSGASGTLTIPSGTSMFLKLIQNPASSATRVINLIFTGAPTVFSIANGELLYIELDRALLDGATPNVTLTDGVNASGTVGRRIVKYTHPIPPGYTAGTTPALDSTIGATSQSTISIPLVIRQDNSGGTVRNIWFVPHGLLWSEAVTSFLGQITTTTTVPLGGIIDFHRPNGDTNSPITQLQLDSYAPGYQLADGSLITNPSSPFFGFYTPNLNGNPAPASGLNASVNTFTRGNDSSATTGYGGSNSNSHTHTMSHTHDHNHQHNTPFPYNGDTANGRGISSPVGGLNLFGTSIVGATTTFDWAVPGVGGGAVGVPVLRVSTPDTIATSGPSTGSTAGPSDANNQPAYFNTIKIIRII